MYLCFLHLRHTLRFFAALLLQFGVLHFIVKGRAATSWHVSERPGGSSTPVSDGLYFKVKWVVNIMGIVRTGINVWKRFGGKQGMMTGYAFTP
jgi:hypothetical protein